MTKLAIALDVPTADEAVALAKRVLPHTPTLKVGLELFCAEGPSVVRQLSALGAEIFLDLKLHDIPNTMAKAAARAADLGAAYLTIHASAGAEAVAACSEATAGSPLRLLAVTVLTSDDTHSLTARGVTPPNPEKQVVRLAELAWRAGARGFVCSGHESALLRKNLGLDAELVVPGVRRSSDALGDQKRVITPAQAVENGANMIVVGRPISKANDPAAAAGIFIDALQATR